MAVPVLKHQMATLGRISRYIGDEFYTDVNLRGRLYPKREAVTEIQHFSAPDRIPYAQAIKGNFQKLARVLGSKYGPTWSTHWFRVDIAVPADWVSQEVRLVWEADAEAMVWEHGRPLQGLSDENRTEFVLSRSITKKELKRTLYIELACNGMFGRGAGNLINPPDLQREVTLQRVDVVVVDREVQDLLYDLSVLHQIAKELPDTHRGNEAMYVANQMINILNLENRDTLSQARKLSKRYFCQKNGDGQLTLHAMGHCHIDSAWLWSYPESIRKCGRSWASVLRLMEKYPDITFACSQAQQYEWVRAHYPAIFEGIRQRVKEGRFIPVGGSWVEMDGNLPSGEAFVRQMLYGQRFFQKHFGIKCTEFWLPDTFGYSSQLPQIVSQAGMTRFLTQKISWGVNKFPHHTFFWEGLDGTRVLTHFPPGDNYCMKGNVDELVKTENNCEDKGRIKNLGYLYGYGDGGGGPTEDMIERLNRMKDVDGLPRVKHSTPAAMFSAIEEEEVGNLLRWVGELYLEFHQGTYTTQAKTKKMNRKCELLLRDVELVSTMTSVQHQAAYQHEQLEDMWRKVLLNQFHDVLPGSSIHEVYEDSDKLYEEVLAEGKRLLAEKAASFANLEPGPHEACVVMNSLGWDRMEVVEVPPQLVPGGSPTSAKSKKKAKPGVPQGCQVASSGCLLAIAKVPSYGYKVLLIGTEEPREKAEISEVEDDTGNKIYRLKNRFLEAEIDCIGRVRSLTKVSDGRNAVATGQLANQFVMFDDQPAYWDAWDVNHYHLETRRPLVQGESIAKITEHGPIRVKLEVSVRISARSLIKQSVVLCATDTFLSFDTWVDWHESHKFLKVEFPLSVRSQRATYDVQFGHLQRPTHQNTKHDWMMFEVGGHKWADLSEHGHGVTLINDCKYGHSCFDNVLRLSLLKSAKAPDESADMGEHTFSYALRPHSGNLLDEGVIREAYQFNCPLQTYVISTKEVKQGQERSYFSMSGSPAIILETVKMDEDQEGDMILRFFEAFGSHAEATVHFHHVQLKTVQQCNILEELWKNPSRWQEPVEEQPSIRPSGNSISLSLSPFKILTLRIKLR